MSRKKIAVNHNIYIFFTVGRKIIVGVDSLCYMS